MALERKTGLAGISAKRLEQFGGRMPFNSLEKPGVPKTASKAKRWTDTGPDDETVELVLRRDKYRCACCAAPTGPAYGRRNVEWCIAHRKLRAQGVDNSPANLYLSCGNGSWGCEAETHRFPQRSRDAGRMLLSTDDPAKVPMVHAVLGSGGRDVLLDNGGGFAVIQVLREEPDEHPF